MNEYLTLAEAELIENDEERIFAIAVLLGFPELLVQYSCTVSAMSGQMHRETVVDFVLENSHGEELYIEVTAGNRNKHRKKRQQKTAALAGIGENYVIVHGHDIATLKEPDHTIRSRVIAVLRGRYNARLFSF